ncbi:DUF5067 domain-containing protein [Absicoccus porci]|uniref:DUF5067 domain-containing protein n=1 Tax=Absicoccus porci TaxID=2486576 RepID=A0A3N0HWL9_9FIRM|nr:DUF5067 domain-containing protein [Absicoccus porci]RNM29048.1 DUF5067 domain-containing protein [Absicoccus porci]
MKKLATLMLVVMMAFSITACGSTEETKKELTNTAEYEECVLTLGDAEITTNDNGEKVAKVNATFTNNSDEPLYAMSLFAVRAFQNDKEITDVSDINGADASLIKEVKDGASVEVSYQFKLDDDSPVEVLIGEPTADQDTIGKQTYFDK